MKKNKKVIKKIPLPNEVRVKRSLENWQKLENYKLQEKSLNLLFGELCPTNKKIENVLLKVSALNDFYSTHVFATYKLARHILGIKIDSKLNSNIFEIVNKIAKVKIKKKNKNFYSFATKYCHHHKPENFPIYDYYVERMLMYYKSQCKNDINFPVYKKQDLKDYPKFIKIINEFKVYFKLDVFTLRDIDIFLWLTGKKYFSRKYGKTNNSSLP